MSVPNADAAAQGTAEETAEPIVIDPAGGTPNGEETPAAEEATSTDDKAAAAPPAEEFESVHDYLMKGLLATDEQPKPEEKPEAAEPPPAATEEEPKAEATEEPETPADDPEAESSETDENTDEAPAILTREEIDAKFPRTPVALREAAAKNGEIALQLQQRFEEYGGEHFAEPMKLIATGLQTDDNMPVLAGVMAAQGVEGFMGLMADIVKVGLIDSLTSEPKNEGEKYFQDECKIIADEYFKNRFGETATPELAAKLLKYEAEGLLNTADVDEFYAGNGEGAAAPSPLVQEQKAKIAELEQKLKDAEATGADAVKTDESRFDTVWEKQNNEASQKALDTRFYSKSVLRDVPTDPPEIKEAKAQVRLLLNDHISSHQKSDPRFSKLKADAYKGNSGTAKFQKALDSYIEDTVFEAKKAAAPLEKAFSLIYQLTQNGKVLATTKPASAGTENNGQQPPPKEPTQTEVPTKAADMTKEQWREHMAREIASGS